MRDFKNVDAKTGCGVVIGIIALIAILAFVTPLFFMWGWNYGVMALFPALPAMEYWTAFFISMFFGAIGGKFHNHNFDTD